MFRRMQYSAVVAGALIYAGAAVHAWRVLPGSPEFKFDWIVLWPGLLFLISAAGLLAAGPARRWLETLVWVSFRIGIGQSVVSVLTFVLVLITLASFIYFDTASAAHGGRFPASAFAAYAAAVGGLLAQAVLVRRIERDPVLRTRIEGAA